MQFGMYNVQREMQNKYTFLSRLCDEVSCREEVSPKAASCRSQLLYRQCHTTKPPSQALRLALG